MWQQALTRGLDGLGLELPAPALAQLRRYVELLVKWNAKVNLTAVAEPEQMVPKHLLDSLAVLPWLHGETVLDVGTGAGLPGLLLAVADPSRHYTLLDSNGKKIAFCEHAIGALGLVNASTVQARVERFRAATPFATVISRAFASIAEFVEAAGALCAADGRMLAMKGMRPDDELATLPAGWTLDALHALAIPGLDAQRHLAVLRKS